MVLKDSSSYLILFNQYSNIIIFICYLWISGWLFYLWSMKKNHLPKINLILLFCLFIVFSSFTYLQNLLSSYSLIFIIFNFVTSLIVMFTSLCIPSVISYISKMPSVNMIIKANEIAQSELLRRELIETEHLILIKNLQNNLTQLELELKRYKWVDRKYENIKKIKDLLSESAVGEINV